MHIWCAHCYAIITVPHVAYAMSVTDQHTLLQDLSAVERFFTVAKRIALFLARTSSQHTIDHLVYEISQQISEDGELAPAALSTDTGVRFLSLIDSYGTLTIQAAFRENSNSSQGRSIIHALHFARQMTSTCMGCRHNVNSAKLSMVSYGS